MGQIDVWRECGHIRWNYFVLMHCSVEEDYESLKTAILQHVHGYHLLSCSASCHTVLHMHVAANAIIIGQHIQQLYYPEISGKDIQLSNFLIALDDSPVDVNDGRRLPLHPQRRVLPQDVSTVLGVELEHRVQVGEVAPVAADQHDAVAHVWKVARVRDRRVPVAGGQGKGRAATPRPQCCRCPRSAGTRSSRSEGEKLTYFELNVARAVATKAATMPAAMLQQQQ